MIMNLLEAPFLKNLRVLSLDRIPEESRIILEQMGIFFGEEIEKLHIAPLGDPVAVRIGEQAFSLRKNICENLLVELC